MRRDTKDRILDAAERLFAEQGFAATSLRQITAEAQVNLAAVNYHFKSKEALLAAVIDRTLAPINQRRLEVLDELEARTGSTGISLDDAVRAFVAPALEARTTKREDMWHFPRLMARLMAEPDERVAPVLMPVLRDITNRFIPIFQRAMDVQDPVTVLWGAQFSIGCMTRCLVSPQFIKTITGCSLPSNSSQQILDCLVCFIVGGMRALAEREKSL